MSGNRNKLIAFNYFGGKFTWLEYLYTNFPRDFTHLVDLFAGSMAGQPQDSPVAMWFSERYSDAYMANRFQTMHIDPSKAGRM